MDVEERMFDAKGTIVGGAVIGWFALCIALCIAGLVGWIMNIVKIFQIGMPLADWGAFEIGRVVGVFLAPLGAVMGFM